MEAENIDEAISKIKETYKNAEVILDSSDFVTSEIKEYKDE